LGLQIQGPREPEGADRKSWGLLEDRMIIIGGLLDYCGPPFIECFLNDFMFELTRDGVIRVSQIVTFSEIKYSKRVQWR